MLTFMVDIQDVVSWHMLFAVDVILVWQETKQLISENFGEFCVKKVENYWNASLVDLKADKICG